MKRSNFLAALFTLGVSFGQTTEIKPEAKAEKKETWIPLFNGKDLSGWTTKIRHHPLGENFANTFTVEDGIIKVSYDGYGKFDKQFGHLYTNVAYSHYILRMEYRFAGKMMADAPSYVNLNSGVMIHSQSPQSMGLDQAFPVSIEYQFLADEGKGDRGTLNICTPGTQLHWKGKLTKAHVINTGGPTFMVING